MFGAQKKFALLAVVLLSITALGVADSYIRLDQGFVIEGYQIMDENRDNLLRYDVGEDSLQASTDIDMQSNQINGFFQWPCPTGEVVSAVNESGGFVCVSVVGESDTAFVNRAGDSMMGTLDMRGNTLSNVDTVTTNSSSLNLDGDIDVSGKVKTDTVDMSSGGRMCIGDQCN